MEGVARPKCKPQRGLKVLEGLKSIFQKHSCQSLDLQNTANATAMLSSGYCSAGGFLVTDENLWQSAIVFTVRLIIRHTWLNDRDQFLQPIGELTEEFKSDCLVWMLFNGSNLTASADGLE
jgi:hypothetical protein